MESHEAMKLGVAAHQTGDYETALSWYVKALEVDPSRSDVLLNLGAVLHETERYQEALEVYNRALAGKPEWGEVLLNRGNTLLELGRYADAIESYGHGLQCVPGYIEALVTIGTSLEHLGRYDEAILKYREAISRKPDCAEAHWNLALALLRQGNFEEGWREFEWRWWKKGYTTARRTFPQPLWDGRQLNGEAILVHSEQAFGDTLQFCRFIPIVSARGGEVILEAPAELLPLLSGADGVRSVVAKGAELPVSHYQVPLLSLPGKLGVTAANLPATVPYIRVPSDRKEYWQARLADDNSFRIGIVWAGRKQPDPRRSCRLKDFAPLADLQGVTFYSLQVGDGSEEAADPPTGMRLVDATSHIRDFADTAALIGELDLVISIDTAVAHLAGAMGKPTFVMVPETPDWRWMLGRSDSPWYPSVRIFRQARPLEWRDVVLSIKSALTKRQ